MHVDYFKKSIEDIDNNLTKLNSVNKKFSIIRLLIFLLFFILLFLGLTKENYIILILSVLFLIIFIITIGKHKKLENIIQYLEFKKIVNREYVYRINCDFKKLSDDGNDLFKNIDEPYLSDLDLYGDNSLFKYISICKTKQARVKLKNRFIEKNNDIIETQQAVDELSNKIDFSIDFQTKLFKLKQDLNKNDLKSNNQDKEGKINTFSLIFGLILLSLLCFTGILLIFNSNLIVSFVSIVFIQVIYGTILYYLNIEQFEFLDKVNYIYYPTYDILNSINNESFNSKLLIQEQNKVRSDIGTLKQYNKIISLNGLRKNFISNIICNIFSLNVFILFLSKKISNINKNKEGFINNAIDALENFQVFISLSTFNTTKENSSIPTLINDSSLNISFTNLMHPLIPEHKCIPNSFELKNRINIITGSNMSGKTSFLRVMGMNLVLMNLGCKINGQSFKANDFKIFSSMRIKDDFINGVSSFYSELLNIKKAIDYQKTNNNMIIFIDEIFRGTNSNDRINGAISLIKQLNKENVILFLTTHDFELCDINLDNIDNFHFEEHYENDKILFDYKIKNGKCNTTNAKYLMKMVGIEE